MKNIYPRLFAFVTLLLISFQLSGQNLMVSAQTSPSPCAGGCSGKIGLVVTGGVSPYSFLWSDGATTSEVIGLCAGTYTVTVTDAVGTTQTATATVALLSGPPPILTWTQGDVSCNGLCNGSIDLTVSGGAAPYTYLWTGGVTTQDRTGLCAGTYTTTVTNANGCTQTAVVTIDQPPILTLTTCATDVSCFGGSNGSIDLTVTGGTTPYTYLWGNGSTTQDLTGLVAGTYTTTVTDANGCTATASATVQQPQPINISSSVTISSNGISNGAIDLTVSGGLPGYTYDWSNDGPENPDNDPQDLVNLSAGTYTVTITDANGCTRSHSVTVQGTGGSGSTPLTLNGVATNSGCDLNCTGFINIAVSGGSAPYNYFWSNGISGSGQSTLGFNNFCPGTYCITVTDASGLAATACFTIGQGQSQYIDIQSSNAAFCNYDNSTSPPICEMVCPHTTVTYFFDPPLLCGQPQSVQGAIWNVSGAEDYSINPNNREVVVTWGEAGPGLVTLASSNPSVCFESSHCVTIVEETVAKFSTDPPAAPNTTLQLCKGQTVSFKNESLNAQQYEWLFSDDLSTEGTENPQHTYLLPGNFSVTLIARSNCLCSDTTVLLVEVLDSQPPILDCVGSVCPGETVKYSTSSNCSSYTWVVSPNGTIVQGGSSGDNSITVTWGQGPTGSISLSASGCGGAACPQASVFIIPIISDNAEIRGNEFVCPESEEEYQIDLFDGTEYTWALPSGGGSIIRGQGTNKVAVAWGLQTNANTTKWLSVDYYNCYLGCGGTDSIPVKILPPFFISGAVEKCEQAPSNFQAKLLGGFGINCNWVIYHENGGVFWTSASATSTLNFPLNAPPGKYRIFSTPANPGLTCSTDAELILSVVARPPKPAAIAGQTVICPGTPTSYEVLGNEPYSVQWTTFNGTPASQSGNPVNVNWSNNPTRWLSALHVSTDGLGCISDTTKLNVASISALSITGSPAACEGSIGYYSADLFQGFEYQWEILPADAAVIKTGQGQNAIEIFWQSPGNHKVRVSTCGLNTEFNVVIHPNPEPIATHPIGLCPGDLGLVNTSAPYNDYEWLSASGTVLSNTANANIMAGAYAIKVTDANGCSGSSDFKINSFPKPNVSVTTSDPTGVCGTYISITALTPDDGVFSYQWFLDGMPFGGNTAVVATNQYGFYSATVINEYGCTASDGTVEVFEYCGGGGGGGGNCTVCSGATLCDPGTLQIVADPTGRCDSFRIVLNDYSGMYVPGSATWRTGISGGGTLVGTATGDNVGFVYPNAGKYIVSMLALLSNGQYCDAFDSLDVEAAAQFSQKLACPGDSTIFVDESTRLPEVTIANWSWDFGEAGTTDTSMEASPGYPFANAGNYTVTLTVTTATGCTSSVSENVFVPDLPAPTFTPPLANCAGNASAFVITNPAGIISTEWDFGHPASGALNQSSGNQAFHNYSPSGNYPVTITATNNYGCTASMTQSVSIVPNPFTGNITPANPVICEGKTITLIAPSGPGANYVWTNGTNLQTLVVDHEGIYAVTLTNGNGCTYSPPDKSVEVNPAPVGTIKALEMNDLGQVIGVSYPTISVCAGEDVNLQIQDNGNYTYQWSGGNGDDEILIFSEDRGNLLSVGTHTFTVTVTNPTTGCTSVLAPFVVTVNPVPSGFSLATNNVCAGSPSTITYAGPQPPTWQIFWNTGENGPTMTTEDAGLYFVRVINEFGCSAQSNTVVIFPGPNVSALPSGCHERCNPDTLCLPALPEIVAWQWFFEGNPIPGATTNQFAATQSGTYFAQLLDVNGCQAQSADLTLELYDGFGNILGQVWSDVNDNGIVDAADTLVAFIPVQLMQNGTLVTGNISGPNGDFEWLNVFSTGYSIQIDTQALSAFWEVVILSDSVHLSGCGGKVFADLLVDAYTCPPILSTVALSACQGTSANYFGVPILAGQSQNFSFTSFLGCDSIVTVTVSALATSASTLSASVCPGTTYTYQGVNLNVGQTQAFTLSNALGCDSIVTVTVNALATSASTLSASVCPGTTYTYQGVNLNVGQTQAFTLNNALGCDSIVTVTVSAAPTPTSTLNAGVCPGEKYDYQGVSMTIGQTQVFTLSTALGCDSIVTVIVSVLPISTSAFSASICPGDKYTYAGVNLAAGQTQDFTLTNYLGCDSIVTVTINALTTSLGAASFGVCPNELYNYQGQSLAAGTVQDYTLSNWLGCDSIVTVSIFEKATSAEIREVLVCPGQSYIYNGQVVEIGEQKDIHFTNSEGCDSLITISVVALPSLDFTLEERISCPNIGTGSLTAIVLPGGSLPAAYSLNGVDFQSGTKFEALATGDYTVTVRDENGCLFEKPASIAPSPNLELELPGAFIIPCDSALITLVPILGGDTAGLQLKWWNGAKTSAITMSEPGSIWLEASNHCGETLLREAEVAWADSDGEPINIYVPNIFAPAAKNTENRTFRAFFGDNLTLLEYRLEVYDRWGNMLFESEQPEIGWDGPFRGRDLNPGVYVWQMWAKLAFCGRELELRREGDVTVER